MGEKPNERVITVGIGWVLLASAIYKRVQWLYKTCLLLLELTRGSVVRALTSIQKVLSWPWVPFFFLGGGGGDFFTLLETLSSRRVCHVFT